MEIITKEGLTTALFAFTFIGSLIVLWGSFVLYSAKRKKGKKNVSNK